MNMLGECNSINSMYMPRSETLFIADFDEEFDNRYSQLIPSQLYLHTKKQHPISLLSVK